MCGVARRVARVEHAGERLRREVDDQIGVLLRRVAEDVENVRPDHARHDQVQVDSEHVLGIDAIGRDRLQIEAIELDGVAELLLVGAQRERRLCRRPVAWLCAPCTTWSADVNWVWPSARARQARRANATSARIA